MPTYGSTGLTGTTEANTAEWMRRLGLRPRGFANAGGFSYGEDPLWQDLQRYGNFAGSPFVTGFNPELDKAVLAYQNQATGRNLLMGDNPGATFPNLGGSAAGPSMDDIRLRTSGSQPAGGSVTFNEVPGNGGGEAPDGFWDWFRDQFTPRDAYPSGQRGGEGGGPQSIYDIFQGILGGVRGSGGFGTPGFAGGPGGAGQGPRNFGPGGFLGPGAGIGAGLLGGLLGGNGGQQGAGQVPTGAQNGGDWLSLAQAFNNPQMSGLLNALGGYNLGQSNFGPSQQIVGNAFENLGGSNLLGKSIGMADQTLTGGLPNQGPMAAQWGGNQATANRLLGTGGGSYTPGAVNYTPYQYQQPNWEAFMPPPAGTSPPPAPTPTGTGGGSLPPPATPDVPQGDIQVRRANMQTGGPLANQPGPSVLPGYGPDQQVRRSGGPDWWTNQTFNNPLFGPRQFQQPPQGAGGAPPTPFDPNRKPAPTGSFNPPNVPPGQPVPSATGGPAPPAFSAANSSDFLSGAMRLGLPNQQGISGLVPGQISRGTGAQGTALDWANQVYQQGLPGQGAIQNMISGQAGQGAADSGTASQWLRQIYEQGTPNQVAYQQGFGGQQLLGQSQQARGAMGANALAGGQAPLYNEAVGAGRNLLTTPNPITPPPSVPRLSGTLENRLLGNLDSDRFDPAKATSPDFQNYVSGVLKNGLAPGFDEAFRRRIYEPQRERLLGDLNRRGVLDSGDRLEKERDLFQQNFMDSLLLQDAEQRRGAAGLSLSGSGLEQQARTSEANRQAQVLDQVGQLVRDLFGQSATGADLGLRSTALGGQFQNQLLGQGLDTSRLQSEQGQMGLSNARNAFTDVASSLFPYLAETGAQGQRGNVNALNAFQAIPQATNPFLSALQNIGQSGIGNAVGAFESVPRTMLPYVSEANQLGLGLGGQNLQNYATTGGLGLENQRTQANIGALPFQLASTLAGIRQGDSEAARLLLGQGQQYGLGLGRLAIEPLLAQLGYDAQKGIVNQQNVGGFLGDAGTLGIKALLDWLANRGK